jgi:outer membrane receptor protein involved in Fe transport
VKLSFPLKFLIVSVLLATSALGQSPNATLSGVVLDTSGRAITHADVLIVNDATGITYGGVTNDEGIYAAPNLPPGPYRVQVSKAGFKTVIKPDIVLNVQAALAINFTLPVGAVAEVVTVEGGAPLLQTESAAVSTVVDRQFAENLPMNGRSFQTLIELTPGVVLTPTNYTDGGQFSVNGQRGTSNYWMVDGVSANTGISSNDQGGNGLGGSAGSFSAQGGTSSLVSIDAMQEFRIQTSTYAPEFGRTPGAQISIVTRSGTNQFHGTAFDYLRNDILDANDWFANSTGLPKPEERQNDFGGTFSGPIHRNKAFFFFSYEGLRLRLPQVALTTVPDLAARQNAVASMQPYLNAFPLPNGTDDPASGIAQFNSSFSNISRLDAYSLRVDHKLSNKLTLFGRYNYSPSTLIQRGAGGTSPLNVLLSTRLTSQTATVGATWSPSPSVVNDLRFNYSRSSGTSHYLEDDFGGAVSLTSLPFPDQYKASNGIFFLPILSLQPQPSLYEGQVADNVQRQINIVDSMSVQKGTHNLKFGVDFRRLSPLFAPYSYVQDAFFRDVPSAENGNLLLSLVGANLKSTFLFRNLGIYAQDTWHATDRLTLTYGLRWDVDFTPRSINGPSFPAVTGFDLNDLSNVSLAPAGTSPYSTTYGNVAPRVGVAYQLFRHRDWQTVVRGGVGAFYDLASSEAGNLLNIGFYPFGSTVLHFGGSFPLDSTTAAAPPIVPPSASNPGNLFVIDPHLKLPYTLEWNVAAEESLGKQQSISVSYIGSAGRRQLRTLFTDLPSTGFTSNLATIRLVTNAATSDYDALQVQFQRRLSRGLQGLASYTWSHSIDDASAGSYGSASNLLAPAAIAGSNRGPSDFDIRNTFSAGFTFEVPSPRDGTLAKVILQHWALQSFVLARSATPIDISDGNFTEFVGGVRADVRPDIIVGQPLYLHGDQYPGQLAINPAAFTDPPTDASGNPVRQGNVSRNSLRGFGATQWDFAVHRDFTLRESVLLQFRAEMFNIVNHPNFGPPSGSFGLPGFGVATAMLSQSLGGGNVGSGGLSPLYQIGGPRSIQLALKLKF